MKTLPLPPITEEIIYRVENRVLEVDESTNCYLTNKSGKRDNIHIDSKTYILTRLVYKIYYGVDPGELMVNHTCDHANCINPLHLFAGTQSHNLKDRALKGRAPDQKGTQSVLATIDSEDTIRAIRSDYANQRTTMDNLSTKYDVGVDTIRRILHYESYTNVADDDDQVALRIERKLRSRSRKQQKNALTAANAADIDELRSNRKTIRRIAYELTLDPRTVRDYVTGRLSVDG
jgi:hypothetical protein